MAVRISTGFTGFKIFVLLLRGPHGNSCAVLPCSLIAADNSTRARCVHVTRAGLSDCHEARMKW